MLISDWSSYVCSSDLGRHLVIPDIVRHRDRDDGARHHHQGGRYRARRVAARRVGGGRADRGAVRNPDQARISTAAARGDGACGRGPDGGGRSEEHTSELQSLMRISDAVFCLKKKKETTIQE